MYVCMYVRQTHRLFMHQHTHLPTYLQEKDLKHRPSPLNPAAVGDNRTVSSSTTTSSTNATTAIGGAAGGSSSTTTTTTAAGGGAAAEEAALGSHIALIALSVFLGR